MTTARRKAVFLPYHLLVAVVLIAVLICDVQHAVADPVPGPCIKDDHMCVRDAECCNGCCLEGKCVKYADRCSPAANACSVHECPPGRECYLQQVQCATADCPPIPACRDPDYDYDDE
ncbi:uncharacterized protein LOC124797851 [Schistocerca piceifrons]|uniref:uncharacterized protein LOC124797851 n=1 Tax=Schistocerca piceifrons TaxID=274613 RepID=UPI001F5F6B57|nr:uncharacterized protein LOC124797851 [Schistocerca piceifrons]